MSSVTLNEVKGLEILRPSTEGLRMTGCVAKQSHRGNLHLKLGYAILIY